MADLLCEELRLRGHYECHVCHSIVDLNDLFICDVCSLDCCFDCVKNVPGDCTCIECSPPEEPEIEDE